MGYLTMLNLIKNASPRLILLGFLILLGACSSENFSRAGYESVKNYDCNKQIASPDCRDNYPSYEEYQREKSKIPE
jgi:hypothetical protein